MKKSRLEKKIVVNVVRNYDGCKGELVERVERKYDTHSGRGRKQSRSARPYRTVSYGGKKFKVFSLPACYGELSGACISIDD